MGGSILGKGIHIFLHRVNDGAPPPPPTSTETNHSPPSSTEIKKSGALTLLPHTSSGLEANLNTEINL